MLYQAINNEVMVKKLFNLMMRDIEKIPEDIKKFIRLEKYK